MECVAYMRVSTEKQAEEGYGLDSQKRDITEYCQTNGLNITDWYVDDGYSGENMDRPQVQRLITDCKRNRVKCVVSFALDRLARSTLDTIYVLERIFLKYGVELKCVHNVVNYETPSEQFQTQILAAVAEYERKNILLRMRGGMLERVKQGYWMGGGNLPYCYLYDDREGVLVPIPERKKQARQAMDLFLQGYSDERIGNIFGLREGTVRSILTSVVNIGKIPYKGNVYNGLHEPIFSEQEFAMLQYNRKIRATKRAYSQTESNLLTGLCVCGVCGCKMRYQKWSNGNHKIYCMSRNSNLAYLPYHNKDCNNTLEWASDIEKQVKEEILKISLKLSKPESHTESKSEMIENAISKEENKLKRYYELYADGNDMVIDLIGKQKTRIEELKAELKAVTKTDNPAKQEIFYEQVKSIADVWDKATQPQRNKILKRIISKIVIVNGNIDIYLNQ